MKLNVQELINFCDVDESASKNASPVNSVFLEELGLSLLVQHFQAIPNTTAEIIPGPCTTGGKRGPRLDGWLKVRSAGNAELYQVEVKGWSGHSIKGRLLPQSPSDAEMRNFKMERWKRYWGDNQFRDKELKKVLTRMKPPASLSDIPVVPLACLWDAVHPEGASEPLFAITLPIGGDFSQLHVFSMSAYLRAVNVNSLEIELPIATEHLLRLERILDWGRGDRIREIT